MSDRILLLNNGVIEQQYVVSNPDFLPAVPPITALAGFATVQTIRQVSAQLRAPYVAQSAVGLERQLPRNTTLAFTYANSHGLHMLRSEVLPGAAPNPIFLMESSGLYNQNQVIANVNSKVNANFSLFGYYMYNHAMSNTDGLNTFPARPGSMEGEYGPAATDFRSRVAIGGAIATRWNLRFSPLFIADSGPPFDITVGRDLFGDTLFNARPGFAADPRKPGVVATPYGLFDPDPGPGQRLVPRNFGRGPGSVMLNLRVGKTIAFGPSKEGGSATVSTGDRHLSGGAFAGGGRGTASVATNRRFNLTISMSVRNLLNHTNPGAIVGNITSPLFGSANEPAGARGHGGTGFLESANNRRLELQTRFSF